MKIGELIHIISFDGAMLRFITQDEIIIALEQAHGAYVEGMCLQKHYILIFYALDTIG